MVAHTSNCRLSGFSIRRPAKSEAANGLYANGRHQCEVIIDVVKETCGPDGVWVSALLTDEERASVTVVEWSEHDTQTLTAGWSCDEERNEFALGLWRGRSSQAQQCEEVVESIDPPKGESISRYLRCDPDAPIGPAVFTARSVIDGGIYTTYGSTNGVGFESSVTISPVAPFELEAADLDLYIDTNAYLSGADYRTDVHVYYWTPPEEMRFVKNMGFDKPLCMPGEGKNFQSTFTHQNPLDEPVTNRAGTFVNKDDLELLLYLDEIHEGLPVPSLNPQVRFNERPTIMRAIRLKSKLIAEDRNAKSFWRLLDNYGTEQKFLLGPSGMELPGYPYLILTGTLVPRPLRLAHFKITLPNGGISTTELYANGRHQCKVVVEVTAEQMHSDGNWAPIRLTQAQRDSLTITRYSANVNEPLPRGWSCDHEKSIYDTGLWNSSLEEGEAGNRTVARAGVPKVQMEQFDRYMRFDLIVPIEDVRFMASIQVGGVTYTTNYTSDDSQFNSHVNIRAVQPYPRLLVKDLVGYVDIRAYNDDFCDIDVYYWTPPNGLRFLVNRGLDAPLYTANEGLNFRTSYNQRNAQSSFYKVGVVVNKDVINPSVLLADIFTLPPTAYKNFVKFDQRPTIMRAVRCRGHYNSTQDKDSHTKWRMWDNYGCEHFFRFEKADSGNVIRLIDAWD